MTLMEQSTSGAPPWYYCRDPNIEWLSVGQFAKRWNKNRDTIRRWCISGFITSLGMSTYRDAKGHWFIAVRLPHSAYSP